MFPKFLRQSHIDVNVSGNVSKSNVELRVFIQSCVQYNPHLHDTKMFTYL